MSIETSTDCQATKVIAPKPRRGGIIRRLVLYPLLLYVTYCTVMYFYQERLLFPADMAPPPGPTTDRYAKNTAVITLDINDGKTNEAWFIPAPKAGATAPAPVAIFFHGNAEIIDYLDEIVTPYRQLGISVYLPEYRGYGRAGGTPSEPALIDDALRFYDELIKRPDVDKSRIVLHGRSLGGGPATFLASKRPYNALVLQSVFTSTADMANTYGAPGFVARHPFRNDRIIPTLNLPILIAHGTLDDIIPVSQGRELARLAKHATFLEYPCNHNGFPGDGKEEEWWDEVAKFLHKAGVLDEASR